MARPKKAVKAEESFGSTDKSLWHKVIMDRAVHDGNGGFYPVGEMIQAPAETIAELQAKGLVE